MGPDLPQQHQGNLRNFGLNVLSINVMADLCMSIYIDDYYVWCVFTEAAGGRLSS